MGRITPLRGHHRTGCLGVLDERQTGCRRYIEGLAASRHQRTALFERLIADNLADGKVGAFLVWGDRPSTHVLNRSRPPRLESRLAVGLWVVLAARAVASVPSPLRRFDI